MLCLPESGLDMTRQFNVLSRGGIDIGFALPMRRVGVSGNDLGFQLFN